MQQVEQGFPSIGINEFYDSSQSIDRIVDRPWTWNYIIIFIIHFFFCCRKLKNKFFCYN